MSFCSFGYQFDLCGAVEWGLHDVDIIPLLACKSDMGPWLQYKYKGSGASGIRGRPKATGTKATSK